MQRIVVDGYNVIHADPELKRLATAGMEGARHALLKRIAAYAERRRVRVTVVFDGRGALVDAEAPLPGRLQVLYSASGQSADDVIVATLRADPNPRAYIVVTDDMADIGRAVRAEGATVMSSLDFLDRCARVEDGTDDDETHADEKPDHVDVDYWLERFGAGEGDKDTRKKGPTGD